MPETSTAHGVWSALTYAFKSLYFFRVKSPVNLKFLQKQKKKKKKKNTHTHTQTQINLNMHT